MRINRGHLPRHVGVIMDGNGRWAQERGLSRVEGHRQGSESVRTVTRLARRLGIKALTLYAFSSQNWKRPAEEIAALMDLLREYLIGERAEIMDNGIRLCALGEIDRLPSYVRGPLDQLVADSAANRGMVLSLALSYGGREEILRACRSLIREGVAADSVDPALLERHLFTRDLPELDLVIRTSGEQRLSNFLLWQAAYAELVFTDIFWPDFREEAFLEALLEYQSRERRFGTIAAQVHLAPDLRQPALAKSAK
jgi:undecaprenyl diphosphate synthase